MYRLTVVIILSALLAPMVRAQAPISDPPTAVFLDSQQPEQARLAAAQQMAYPTEAVFAVLLQVLQNQSEPDAIRAVAADRHRYDDPFVETALGILADPNNGGAELNAKLIELIRRRTVTRPAPARAQRIQSVLRPLLDDARAPVRLEAYRALSGSGDSVAIKKLADSLAPSATPALPVLDSLELLDLAGSVDHLVAVRRFLADDRAEVQAAAAKILASDPQSRPRVVELATDTQSSSVVRVAALRALSREDAGFEGYAINLVQNASENGSVRSAAVQALVGRMNNGNVAATDQVRFATALETMVEEQGGAVELTATGAEAGEAQKTLHYLVRKFPAVKEHYDNR